MLNIALYIENQEIEMDKELDFAINRTYDELQNPTTILNDWSKTIEIPMTVNNNQLFGSIFNVERRLVSGGSTNRGVYFNPTKKANFKLMYNQGILMSGYAKLASVDNVNHTYQINLFGEVGNTFLELLKCSFNISEETEMKYQIPNYIQDDILTKELVRDSWLNDSPRLSLDDEECGTTDIIGFTPTICGLPSNFQADTMIDDNGEFVKIGELINTVKGITYGESIIGDGLTERQMGQFRIWNEKPYIYVNKLWQMMVKKSEEICEYPLRLDKVWFNKNNPYYTDLIYFCTDYNKSNNTTTIKDTWLKEDGREHNIYYFRDGVGDDIYTLTFYLKTTVKYVSPYNFTISPNKCLNIKLYKKDGTVFDDFVITGKLENSYDAGYTTPNKVNGSTRIVDGLCQLYVNRNIARGMIYQGEVVSMSYQWLYRDEMYADDYTYGFYDYDGGSNVIVSTSNRKETLLSIWDCLVYNSFEMGSIWNPDIAPFDVLLNYSKMFGLVFIVNQNDKCIDITSRNVYFDNYKIQDWTDKVNTLNTYKIEQPTFGKKYVNFNYDDVDADVYKDYFDKYQIALGGKRLITEYEFNNDSEDLFEGIQPTDVANEVMYGLKQLVEEWIVGRPIPKYTNNEVYFNNKKDNGSANIYSAFAFRRKNQPVDTRFNPIIITEDTAAETNASSFCYHPRTIPYDKYHISMTVLPYISTIEESNRFGCIFNLPNEIHFNPAVVEYTDAQFVYDSFWRDYINERYSTDNKRITLQANITPFDFAQFEFRNFVKIENTLYIINAIKDYGISDGIDTNVELITVNNIDAYRAGTKFHYAFWEMNEISVVSNQGNPITLKMRIEGDTDWHVFCPTRGAITFDKTSGTGDDEITMTIQDLRQGVYSRQLTVNILNNEGEVMDVLIINQVRQ